MNSQELNQQIETWNQSTESLIKAFGEFKTTSPNTKMEQQLGTVQQSLQQDQTQIQQLQQQLQSTSS